MIVWKGWGILALIVPLIFSWTANFVFDFMYGAGFYQGSTWAMPLIIGSTALPVGIIGYRLNNKPERILIDPIDNKEVKLKSIHSMFWIPLQYWSIIIIAICFWMYASNTGLIYKK